MKLLTTVCRLNAPVTRVLDWGQPVLLLAIRLHVALVFWKSGVNKFQSFDTTVKLFTDEYKVPLLSPYLAAWLGTAAELALPALLAFGLLGRLSAIGLFVFNLVAVAAYWHVLKEVDAALDQHFYWGFLLLVPVCFGVGKLSLDWLLGKKFCKN